MQATDPSGPALQARGPIRFAVFEVDLRSGEVRKNGLKVRLTGQPFQVLAMLLERPGEVVAREDLQKRLWPSDTFVDFDHSLNTAINKIREALGDSAESPRFVETLPRRGYRFIAPVEAIGLAGGGLSALAAQGPLQGLAGGAGQTAEPASRKRWPLAVGVALGLLAAAVLGWYVWQRSRPRPELTERRLTTNSSEIPVWASAISPDGRHLACSDDSGIHLRVIDTAEIHTLPAPPDSKIDKLVWFPDGDRLLASVEAGQPRAPSLWSISILGGAPRKLRDDASDGEVLRDGTGIVFVGGGGREIWQMGPEGDAALKLLTASTGESFGMPFVIGTRLWYGKSHATATLRTMGGTANNWNRLEGYEMESRNINGGPPTILVPDLRAGTFLLNGRFVYSGIDRRDLVHGGSLWEIGVDLRTGQARAKPRRIADWADDRISDLSATADGKRLTYLTEKDLVTVYQGDLENNGLHLADPRRLTLSDSFDNAYDWTPDSKSVLFDSNRNGTWDIFRQDHDQRTAERLVAGAIRPAMAPDGASILYFTDPGPASVAVFLPERYGIMRSALLGGPPQLLGYPDSWPGTIRCAHTVNACVVSENNQQIAWYALDPVKGIGRELFKIDPSDLPEHKWEWDWTAWDQDWDLSPDGSGVAVPTRRAPKGSIEILPLAGGRVRELSLTGWANPMSVHWSPDGKSLFLIAFSTKDVKSQGTEWPSLLRVDLQGKVQVLRQQSDWLDPIPSPDGRHLALLGQVTTRNVWMSEYF